MISPSFQQFAAMRIYESPAMVSQFRFPISKRARIRKKWRKRPENFRPSDKILIGEALGNCLICHPRMAAKIRAALAERRAA